MLRGAARAVLSGRPDMVCADLRRADSRSGAGWPVIASGAHTLIQAPTGSGKTLAAFLWALDQAAPGQGLQVLYVSPLKALNYDVERNLRGPLAGIGRDLAVAVRTGDTPAKERAAILRRPPEILITTPESLFLMLTSQAREILRGVGTLILDEIHAVAATKRGAHLAVSVERLERLADSTLQRIALSATQRPLEEIGRFVSGGRPIEVVDAGRAKELDLEVVVPVDDMREPSGEAEGPARSGRRSTRRCSSSSRPIARRSLRQQPPPRRAARRSPERARGASRSPGPTTARSRESSGSRSRSS